MLDWQSLVAGWQALSASDQKGLDFGPLVFRLVLSAIYGGCVSIVYRMTHGRLKLDSSILATTLVLLSILIAMVSMVIGDNVARAFSLVGALSIVRFRTVVEDTRDTAFVIFAVIVGMAAGAGSLLMPLVGIPLVGLVAVVLSRVSPAAAMAIHADTLLVIRLGIGRDPKTVLVPIFDRFAAANSLKSIETAKQGAALDLTYQLNLHDNADMIALVTELNKTEGVQNVEVRN